MADPMSPVCAVLHYVHQMGVVYGDLKSANIIIHEKETVLITDVGLNRIVETGSSFSQYFPGTPTDIAPEQIHGQYLTPQSDIYALGIVMFEMLTGGKRPFDGEHAKTISSTDERISGEQIHLSSV